MTIRAATRETVTAYYGEMTRETIRGKVAYLDDEAVGIIGLARTAEGVALFSEYKPELEPYLRKMVVLRAVREVLDMARKHRCQVHATADTEHSQRILHKYGFADKE